MTYDLGDKVRATVIANGVKTEKVGEIVEINVGAYETLYTVLCEDESAVFCISDNMSPYSKENSHGNKVP